MDPISIIGALVTILRVAIQQVDHINKIAANQRTELVRFRQACESLKDSLSLYKSLYDTYLSDISGAKQAFTALLRTQLGKDAHRAFLSKLQQANATYREAAKTTQQPRTHKTGFLATLPLVLSDVVRGTSEEIASASAKVSSSNADLARSFKLFHGLYLHHLSSTRTFARKYALRRAPSASDLLRSIDAAISAFHANPFGARKSGSPVTVEQLCCINTDRKALDEFVLAMRDVGSGWIEEGMEATLDDRAQKILRTGLTLMELLWSTTLEEHKGLIRKFPPQLELYARETDEPTGFLDSGLVHYISKSKDPKFTIAFCGMVKAGKSLFLNALMGRTVLPSDELPSTAWPCRIRHKPNLPEPVLTLDTTHFEAGLRKLRKCGFGKRMQNYKPPEKGVFCLDLDDFDSSSSTSNAKEKELADIYRCWSDLHKSTHLNLINFEDRRFTLPNRAEGVEAIRKLLGELNDIVRLCLRFRLGFRGLRTHNCDWPLLEVEFSSLKSQQVDCIFEFIDLPGLGEHFEEFAFEGLIRRVATEATTVVPIVNFKEIPRDDWRKLPNIIRNAWDSNIEFVVCTHYDQVSGENLPAQMEVVKQVFAPKNILPCSSLMGLSASATMQKYKNQETKPRYSDLLHPTDGIQIHCVKTILGTGAPRKTYLSLNNKEWKFAVNRQLTNSGLPTVTKALSVDLISNARQKALKAHSEQLQIQLKRLMRTQSRILLVLRRSESELDAAFKVFVEARGHFDDVLETWEADELVRDKSSKQLLQKNLTLLKKFCKVAVKTAFQNTVKDERYKDMFFSNEESTVVEFKKKSHAEVFLHESQKRLVNELKEHRSQFVSTIRQIAERSREVRVQRLREAIMSPSFHDVSDLREEILMELDETSNSLQSLVLQHARKVLKTERIRYNYKTAFRGLEEAIATPVLMLKGHNFEWSNAREGIDELGFLLKAPIYAAVVPAFVIGSVVWPLMTKTKKHILTIAEAEKHYNERIVEPFLQGLGAEAEKSLMNASKKTSEIAKDAVVDGLKREESRYEKERDLKLKNCPLPKEDVASLVWMYGTLAAVRAALEKLGTL